MGGPRKLYRKLCGTAGNQVLYSMGGAGNAVTERRSFWDDSRSGNLLSSSFVW